MKKLKSDFTISEIGKFQFYSGITIGVGFSFILNSLFRLTLKIGNLGIDMDKWNLSYEINSYYYILIGFASIAFSFCFTTYLWMSKLFEIKRTKTVRLRMAQINSIWIFFGSLLFLLRMLWFFTSVELTIEKDFPVLGFMLPIFIYLYCWNLISYVYKTRKPFLITSAIFIISGFILSFI